MHGPMCMCMDPVHAHVHVHVPACFHVQGGGTSLLFYLRVDGHQLPASPHLGVTNGTAAVGWQRQAGVEHCNPKRLL